jgi:hypothetical protein
MSSNLCTVAPVCFYHSSFLLNFQPYIFDGVTAITAGVTQPGNPPQGGEQGMVVGNRKRPEGVLSRQKNETMPLRMREETLQA